MKYQGNALGLVETRGMVPVIAAGDAMCKAADVNLLSYENVGSGLTTVLVVGDVAAVETAVEAGAKSAAACGELTASNVMPRPIGNIKHIVDAHELEEEETEVESCQALGFIETYGLVSVLEAADAMCKAADVELIGYENVASGLLSVIVSGDVGAVQSAVEAGVKRAEAVGPIYAQLVIPSPHPSIVKIARKYAFML